MATIDKAFASKGGMHPGYLDGLRKAKLAPADGSERHLNP